MLAYFVRSPNATDSLEGIARWRVRQEIVEYAVDDVAQALDWLAEEGRAFLLRVGEHRAGVATQYRLNPAQAAEAELFLRSLSNRQGSSAGRGARAATEADRLSPPHSPPSSLTVLSLAWVDATLLRFLRQQPPNGSDIPGLTRSYESVAAVLAPRVVPPTLEATDAFEAATEATHALVTAFNEAPAREPLAALYRNLELTPLELQAVLLCLAPEVDVKYQTVCGVLHDDLGRRSMTLGLLCAVLGDPLDVRKALSRSRGLTRWRLLEHGATLPYADEPLRLDSAVVAWVLGYDDALLSDPRLSQVLRTHAWPGARWIRQRSDLEIVRQLAGRLSAPAALDEWITLAGEDVDGSRAIAEAAAELAASPLVRISVASLATVDPMQVHETAARLTRAIQIAGAVPILDTAASKPEGVDVPAALTLLVGALADAGRPAVVITRNAERIVAALPFDRSQLVHRDPPGDQALVASFAAAAGEAGLQLGAAEIERLATAFPLPLSGIDSAVQLAALQGAALQPPSQHAQTLTAACRRIAAPDLPRFARRVDPVFTLEQVVLPPDRHAQLNEMVAHVRYASQVLNSWGFKAQLPYGHGVAALFCGPSGAGKTMATQAIAHALQTEAYVVDLSRVVSKYIGESEKNLDAVFSDAERAGAVLVIDEADALFGRRTEIKDAHDRYANIEVAYLLQRMEAFGGLAILTTNFRRNVDEAFLRRLRFIVEFPKPDAPAREAIWRQCLPRDAPLSSDLNLRLLARRLELMGGQIRLITLRAAFTAAGEGAPRIDMRHLLSAARAELLKIGKQGAGRELAEFEAAERKRAASRVA